jgi:TPR repeat protein
VKRKRKGGSRTVPEKRLEQGESVAQYNLGLAYYYGEGFPQNYKTAYIWFSLSAANADEDQHEKAADLRDEVAKKLTPAQLEQAQQIASEWKPKTGNKE